MQARVLTELRRRPTPREVDEALSSLVVVLDDAGVASVMRTTPAPNGVSLFEATMAATRIRLGPGVYGRTPTAAARVRLLEAAARIGPRVEVHAPLASTGSHRGRLVIDLPRRAARAVGLPAAEPGDRFDGAFAHFLFDDEALIHEAARAGLAYAGRHEAWVRLDRTTESTTESAAVFATEVLRTLAVVRVAERLRRAATPEDAVRRMRARGRESRRRGPIGRARLRRAIGWVDAFHPGGPNCFRRTLAEIGLDAGAAGETLVFGLDVGRTGHVALRDSEELSFDVAFEIAPEQGPPPSAERR